MATERPPHPFDTQAQARGPDIAKLPRDPDQRMLQWHIEYLDGKTEALGLARLLSTDAAFAKFRRPDLSLVLVSTRAIRSIHSA